MTRSATTAPRALLCALAGALLLSPAVASAADEKSQTKPAAAPSNPSEDAAMAEMMKLATPGAPHELLKQFAGSWKCVTKVWMAPGDPQVSQGMSEKTVILGGRFLQETYNGIFMGEPFSGTGVTGYDNNKKEYIGNWVDTLGTGQMIMEGKVDASGKVITWTGTSLDPMTMKDKEFKMVTRLNDKNSHTFSFFDTLEGKEVMTMEITYTRK